ncbi:MAG TPA: hypothetical protein VEW04_01775 [Allosphingosinicella sp.]|jgi:hypothetical protein|nr:hypothetical protein [Allosphingosinicella sp.]
MTIDEAAGPRREPPAMAPDDARGMMSQRDIVAFLASHGVQTLEEWRPGEPVLYVIEDPLRTDTAHYRDLPRRLRPSFARLDNPDRIDPSARAVDKDGVWTQIFEIVNESGGRVDYYAIDPDTHAVTFVRSSATKRDKAYPYVAQGNLLFRTKDELLPKS